jgi:DNA-directed RNA polymerase alpha subunit
MEEISDDAKIAIAKAVEEEHSVFCLEQLGVPTRLLNLLHQNGIRTVAELVSKTPEQVQEVPNLGSVQFKIIMRALAKYHKIEDL